MSDKSLQININSVDDAKSCIANQTPIKAAYDAHNCTSVELCIAEEVVTPTAKILVGVFPWCVHYRKIIKPFDGNVLFQLPHYQHSASSRLAAPAVPATPVEKAPKQNRYLRNLPADLGKSAAPVQPLPAGVS